jgi:diamine N-acetyltransferase
MANVELREITKETARTVMNIEVAEDQRHLVAPTMMSIAEAYFEPKAWFRAIYADDEPVGFVMLYDDPDTPEYYLWRLLVGAEHQRKGYGRAAVEHLVDYVRTRPGAMELLVGWVPGPGSPEPFYRSLGFEPTGEIDHGEVQASLRLG